MFPHGKVVVGLEKESRQEDIRGGEGRSWDLSLIYKHPDANANHANESAAVSVSASWGWRSTVGRGWGRGYRFPCRGQENAYLCRN